MPPRGRSFLAALWLLATILFLPAGSQERTCWTLFESHKKRFASLIEHGGDQFYDGRFLHFLHVPRTAGRTFFSCFLRPNWRPSKRCPRAYDAIRMGDAYPNCTMLSSHDDFSLSDFLPPDTAYMTQLRDPVDRFISAYEMAVEVAVRKLARPPGFKPDPRKTSTKDVWPWSYLVEMFEDDITDRQAKLKMEAKGGDLDKYPAGELDAYNNALVLPLEGFVEHDLAHEMLHNGQTLQILGITNYSRWDSAEELRRCFFNDSSFQEAATDFAMEMLEHYIHVGLTPNLKASMDTFLPLIDRSWNTPAWKTALPSALSELRRTRRAAEQAAQMKRAGQTQTGGVTTAAKRVGGATSGIGVTGDETVKAERENLSTTTGASRRRKLSDIVHTMRGRTSTWPFQIRGTQGDGVRWEQQGIKVRVETASDELLGSAGGNLAELRGLGCAHEPPCFDGDEDYQLEVGQDLTATYSVATRKLLDRSDVVKRQETLSWAVIRPEMKDTLTDRLIQLDKNGTSPKSVAENWVLCSDTGRKRNDQRRKAALRLMKMPDGRSTQFTYAARNAIPQRVLDRLRVLNKADLRLFELGQELLQDYKTLQEGAWEDLGKGYT